MSESNFLHDRFAQAYDNFQDHAINMDPLSIEDRYKQPLLIHEAMLAQWAATLDVKTKHNLMKATLDNIK